MTNRIPEKILNNLKVAREAGAFQNASFGFPNEKVTDQRQGKDFNKDAYIKEQTHLYRETWLLPVLDEIIAWGEGKIRTDQIHRRD